MLAGEMVEFRCERGQVVAHRYVVAQHAVRDAQQTGSLDLVHFEQAEDDADVHLHDGSVQRSDYRRQALYG